MSFLSKIEIKADDSQYYTNQINRILDHAKNSEYPPSIQIRHEGEATKWMSINLNILKDLITSYKKHVGDN